MPHLDPPSWREALGGAFALVALSVLLLRRWRTPALAAREAALVLLLDGIWQLLSEHTHSQVAGAQERALTVWHTERVLHLPSELALQGAVLPHPDLVRWANAYYLYGHLNALVLLLVWTWWRHRPAYPHVRLTLVLLTLSAFLVQLVPVAPPRLVPGLGFTDTATLYGQSVYGSFGDGLPGQLLAMPSLHVGWALLCAYAVLRYGRGPWRYLVLLHAALMVLVVVVTANHWLLDGIVAGGLLALAVPAAHLLLSAQARRRVPARVPVPVPEASLVG